MEKTYRLGLYFKHNIEEIERKIIKLLGISDASGSGFGQRDLAYYFDNKNSLYTAVKKIKKLSMKVKCEAYDITHSPYGKKIILANIK